jgi:hypothetical protein
MARICRQVFISLSCKRQATDLHAPVFPVQLLGLGFEKPAPSRRLTHAKLRRSPWAPILPAGNSLVTAWKGAGVKRMESAWLVPGDMKNPLSAA